MYLTPDVAKQWLEFAAHYWNVMPRNKQDVYIDLLVNNLPPEQLDLRDAEWQKPLFWKRAGLTIRLYRERLGISQIDIANLLHLSTPYMCTVELGQKTLSAFNLGLIIDLLKIPAHEIFGPFPENSTV